MDISKTQRDIPRTELPLNPTQPVLDRPPVAVAAALEPAGEDVERVSQPFLPSSHRATDIRDDIEPPRATPGHRDRVLAFMEMLRHTPPHLLPELGAELINGAARLPSREPLDALRSLGVSFEPRSESNPHGYDPYRCPISAAIGSAQWEMIVVLLEFGVWPGPPILQAYEFMPPVVKEFLRPYVLDDGLFETLDAPNVRLPADWLDLLDSGTGNGGTTASITTASTATSTTSTTSTTSNSGPEQADEPPAPSGRDMGQ